MDKSSEISFDEFLKEDLFKEEKTIVSEVLDLKEKPIKWLVDNPAAELETKAFWVELRQFYRTGKKPKDSARNESTTALLAQFENLESISTSYPFYLGTSSNCSLKDLLESTFNEVFEEGKGQILKENLPRLEQYVYKRLQPDKKNDFSHAIDRGMKKLATLDVHGSEGKTFKKHLKKLTEALPESGYLIRFSQGSPLFILGFILNEFMEETRQNFKSKLQYLASGLKDLLSQEKRKDRDNIDVGKLEKTYDFVNEIIAFDQLSSLMPATANEFMPATRLKRLRAVLKEISTGLEYFQGNVATIVLEKSLKKKFDWSEIFKNVNTIEADDERACQQCQVLFNEQIGGFTALIKAYRIAQLELEDKYKEEIHDDYFSHFTWHRLFEEELNLFHPIVLILKQKYLLNRLSSLSELLASNQPVKVVAINSGVVSEPDQKTSWEDAAHQFKQELTAVAISQRSAYTFQAGIDNPAFLFEGLSGCLNSTSPSFCHLLLPQTKAKSEIRDYLSISAAVEGRYFPKIIYDQKKGAEWGSRFDISANPQSGKSWPQYTLTAKKSDDNTAIIDIAFTYADYKAIYPAKSKELMLVPSTFYTEDLVPLSDYLELPEEQLYGKVPYIWLIDRGNELHRAAVPNMWVISCQERLDFWNFIQELGGVNSYHVKKALALKEEEIQNKMADEIGEMKETHRQELEKTRNEAAGQAMEKLTAVLLDLDDLPATLSTSNNAATNAEMEVEPKKEETPSEEKVEEEETMVISEPWVDSIRCTSCNECTDKYSSLFKYNDEKQAYLTDPSKGTFEQLVMAAEECPALCIHPGQPQNPSEPDLDSLIKRAEKFN